MASSILIVEDEQLVALDIQRRLTQLGHHVVAICDRAETALDAVVHHRPDLILMDIHLKGEMDGIALAGQVWATYQLPIVFLTAHADEATVTQAKATHPFGYLIKPIQTNHLSTAIEIALSRHQAETVTQRALERERELSDALQRALEKEKELNELKSQFVSIVSHEFRNPLNAIATNLDILEQHNAQLTSEQRLHYLHQIKDTTSNLAQLFEDILTLSETESVQFQCHPVPVDILWFCQELVNEWQAHPETNHTLHLHVQTSETIDTTFYNLDPKLLRHILTNLLSNAIKYSPPKTDIELSVECTAEMVRLNVQDQGIGISMEDQYRLFNPFCRGSNVKGISGTGLGLFIVKKCVDAHGGSITVNSALGSGTEFSVTIPVPLPHN